MRLTPTSRSAPAHDAAARRRRERRGLVLGLGGVIFALLLLLLRPLDFSSLSNDEPERLFCGAEQSHKDHFSNNGHQFSGVEYRSGERSRNGRYAIALPADGQTHYGFSTTLEDVPPGGVYEVSVWSFDNDGSGKLAVRGGDPDGFYAEQNAVERRDQQGWAEHRLRFYLPFEDAPDRLHVYVYTSGGRKIFFDDLLIERVDQWDATIFQPTRLHLRLDRAARRRLAAKRDEALARGVLQTEDDDWVDGTLTERDTTYDVKLRLKGDWLDHLRGDKWSYRVKLKDQRAWRGMRTFSLHTPAARYYLHEWLLHRYWRDQGVLTTRYDFVELIVDGEFRGIYAYEEHFEKQLVESQQRREGPLVKFSEDGYWATIARQLGHHGFVRTDAGYAAATAENAPAVAFGEDELREDPLQARLLTRALALLERYRAEDTPPGEIFDLELLARYYVGCDLFNAYHGIVWHNQRFYYNPITTRLEPVGFDGFAEAPSRRYHFLAEGTLRRNAAESTSLPAYLLRDSVFMRVYLRTVESLSRPTAWTDFFQRHEAGWTARLQWLQREFPTYRPDPATLAEEVAFVRSHLLPFPENVLRGYRAADGGVMVENTHTLPVEIVGYGSTADRPTAAPDRPIWLPAGPVRKLLSKLESSDAPLPFRAIDFWDDQARVAQATPHATRIDPPASTRFVFLRLPGWDTLLAAPLRLMPPPEELAVTGTAFRRAATPARFPSLRWDTLAKIITVPGGVHRLTEDLIVPADYRLQLMPGADVQLNERAAIISYGAVRALGEAEQPITIQTGDGTGQGLQVLQAETASILRHVIFRGLRPLSKGDWQLTGAVTFYESAVQMEACRFLDNQSEDALNLVRCDFEMHRCLVQNTSSDGFDADFCKGRITHSAFRQTGNDGVDFSGSIVTLEDVVMEDCGDKGVSAGEASDITVDRADLSGCQIGLAAKDRSTLYVRRSRLQNGPLGLAVFQKKPEFGPAYLLVEALETENIERLYQIGPGSRLQIDNEMIQ